MKRFARLVLPPVTVFGLASLSIACFSSSAAPPGDDSGAPADDSGSTPDSTVPPVDGGSNDAAKDAPATDAEAAAVPPQDAADAAVEADAAPPTTVTVRVILGATPESGVLVAFQDATGAVLASGTTDATGTIIQVIATGSQLTAALGTAQKPNLVTVQDVAPGDVVTLLDYPPTSLTSFSENLTVTPPASTWDAGTQVYFRAGGCGDPAGYPVYLTDSCVTQGTYPLFAQASDAVGEVAYTYQKGSLAATDGGPGAVTITRAWSTSPGTETIAASSLPAGQADAGVTVGSITFDYSEFADGLQFALPSSAAESFDAGLPSNWFPIHPGYPDFTQEDAYLYFGLSGSSLESEVAAVTRTAPASASEVTSLALGTLPGFTSASLDTTDAGSLVQPVFTWTTTGSLAAANGIFTMVQWYGPPPDGGTQGVNGTWTIVAPATATQIKAPSMPATAAAFTPGSTATYNPPRVVAVQSPFLAGYGAFKSQFATIPVFTPFGSWSPTIPTLPANGQTVFFSAIYPNEG